MHKETPKIATLCKKNIVKDYNKVMHGLGYFDNSSRYRPLGI